MQQVDLPLDGFCCGPLFAPVRKVRPPKRPKGKEGVVHRAQTLRATPAWLSPEQWCAILRVYAEAKRRTQETGELHVVDHVVPKISPYVCGLHVPWNLEVVHWRPNAHKGNFWWPDMWNAQAELL